jgi:hypothetical protein
MDSNIKNSYNMRKIKKFNNIDQMYSQNDLKKLILKSQKIEKPNINLDSLINNKQQTNSNDLKESIKKRTNEPYKGIIKNFDYSKIREQHVEDLIIHKVNDQDKNIEVFDSNLNIFHNKIEKQNIDIKDTYSIDKKTEHKKEFDYQLKYKYRTKIDSGDDDDIRIDRIEFYKKEQSKIEENKKKIDDILLNLIDSGILSDNLESIDYDKLDTNDLENKLKNIFGEDEFNKILKELE